MSKLLPRKDVYVRFRERNVERRRRWGRYGPEFITEIHELCVRIDIHIRPDDVWCEQRKFLAKAGCRIKCDGGLDISCAVDRIIADICKIPV
jgi:hypothetical protein